MQETPNRQNNLRGKNDNVSGPTLANFKAYYRRTVIRTVWYWHNDRHSNQWNII